MGVSAATAIVCVSRDSVRVITCTSAVLANVPESGVMATVCDSSDSKIWTRCTSSVSVNDPDPGTRSIVCVSSVSWSVIVCLRSTYKRP